MAHCHKCGRVCGTTYVSNSRYFCKACWDSLPNGGVDPLSGFVINMVVHVGLPIIGIAAIFIVCQLLVGFVSEKFGLTKEISGCVWLGVSAVLSLPLLIKALRGLWTTWCVMHWLLKTFFCVCCPPLVILLIMEWLIKLFRKR